MKICKYCDTQCADDFIACHSCGGVEFKNVCNSCRAVFDSPFCPSCGVKAGTKAKKCPSCGTKYFTNACPSCGYIKKSSQQTASVNITNINAVTERSTVIAGQKPKSKWTAFILCLFLGLFGAHKFYEGNTKMGIVYLFTMGLFGIGWIVDTIVILFKSNPYYV